MSSTFEFKSEAFRCYAKKGSNVLLVVHENEAGEVTRNFVRSKSALEYVDDFLELCNKYYRGVRAGF